MKMRLLMRPAFVNILNKIDEVSQQSIEPELKSELFLAKMLILEMIANGRSTMENDIMEIYDRLLIDDEIEDEGNEKDNE